MSDFWNIIVETNTFNFAILVIIFAVVFVKLDINKIIQKIKDDVTSAIENAKSNKAKAHENYISADKLYKTVPNEIKEQNKQAQATSDTLTNAIKLNADKQVASIESNIEQVITNEEKQCSMDLTYDTTTKAMELAKQKIINLLNDDLHEKFIKDSIDELSRVKL